MPIKTLDPRMINPGEKFTNTTNTYISNLTSDNIVATNIAIPGGNSNSWNTAFTLVQVNSALWEESADITAITTTVATNSASWQSAYATTTALSSNLWNDVYTSVQNNSASWEESTDIVPTVTNYLSTSNVQVSALSLSAVTFTNRFTVATTLTATTTVLEVLVNGTSKYLPLFDIN